MNTLILHPTETSQWYAMVNEAEATTGLVLSENTESYLVFLLMRFSQGPRLMESVIALDFMQSMSVSGQRQITLLKDVGDKSLLLCGLFPGIAERRRVSLSYYSDMGQSAYLSAADLQDREWSRLYVQLSEQFPNMQSILRAMRGLPSIS